MAGVGEFIFPGDGIYFGDIDVESAHSYMTVAAEIEVAVRTEGREHLNAWTKCLSLSTLIRKSP